MSGLSLQTAALPPAPLLRRTACIDLLLAGSRVAYVDVRLLEVTAGIAALWGGVATSVFRVMRICCKSPCKLVAGTGRAYGPASKGSGGGALATSCWARRVIPIIFLFFPPPAKAATPAMLRDRYRFVSSLTVEGRTKF